MTNRVSAETWFYVVATVSDGRAIARTRRMLGPFDTWRAASAMLRPVRFAILKHYADDPAFDHCDVVVREERVPVDKPLPAGALDLKRVVDQDWIDYLTL